MNRIHALALVAGLMALPPAGAQAQQADSVKRQRAPRAAMTMRERPNAAARILVMREDLKLTSEQVARLEALQKRQADQREQAMEQMRAARKQLAESAEAARNEIEATLNDEQEAQLQKRGERAERRVERLRMHRERMRMRRGERGGENRGA